MWIIHPKAELIIILDVIVLIVVVISFFFSPSYAYKHCRHFRCQTYHFFSLLSLLYHLLLTLLLIIHHCLYYYHCHWQYEESFLPQTSRYTGNYWQTTRNESIPTNSPFNALGPSDVYMLQWISLDGAKPLSESTLNITNNLIFVSY